MFLFHVFRRSTSHPERAGSCQPLQWYVLWSLSRKIKGCVPWPGLSKTKGSKSLAYIKSLDALPLIFSSKVFLKQKAKLMLVHTIPPHGNQWLVGRRHVILYHLCQSSNFFNLELLAGVNFLKFASILVSSSLFLEWNAVMMRAWHLSQEHRAFLRFWNTYQSSSLPFLQAFFGWCLSDIYCLRQ